MLQRRTASGRLTWHTHPQLLQLSYAPGYQTVLRRLAPLSPPPRRAVRHVSSQADRCTRPFSSFIGWQTVSCDWRLASCSAVVARRCCEANHRPAETDSQSSWCSWNSTPVRCADWYTWSDCVEHAIHIRRISHSRPCLSSNRLLLLSPGRGAEYCDQSVCLCVCLCPQAYLWNRWHEILCADPLWPWLGLPPAEDIM